jgi:hypothetical protein
MLGVGDGPPKRLLESKDELIIAPPDELQARRANSSLCPDKRGQFGQCAKYSKQPERLEQKRG